LSVSHSEQLLLEFSLEDHSMLSFSGRFLWFSIRRILQRTSLYCWAYVFVSYL